MIALLIFLGWKRCKSSPTNKNDVIEVPLDTFKNSSLRPGHPHLGKACEIIGGPPSVRPLYSVAPSPSPQVSSYCHIRNQSSASTLQDNPDPFTNSSNPLYRVD